MVEQFRYTAKTKPKHFKKLDPDLPEVKFFSQFSMGTFKFKTTEEALRGPVDSLPYLKMFPNSKFGMDTISCEIIFTDKEIKIYFTPFDKQA